MIASKAHIARNWRAIPAVVSILGLAACGSSEEPPVEQIVVREPGEPPLAQAATAASDLVARGEAAFAACIACHSVEPDAASGAGPNLLGIVGRQAAALDDFDYSDALATSRMTWSESELDAFLADPSGKVPGTTMVAGAVGDADRRAAIVAYLASLTQ